MKLQLSEFEIELGDDWTLESSLDRPPLVFHDRDGGELIVSASGIVGRSLLPVGDPQAKLVANALVALRHAASHPDLLVTEPLTREELVGFTRWSMTSVSKNSVTLLGQLVWAGKASVVLFSFEAQNGIGAVSQFKRLHDAVRLVPILRV